MPPRYQSTLLSFEEKARNLFDHFGQPAHRGHARVGGGLQVGGQGQSLIQNPLPRGDTSGAAQLLALSVTGDSITPGGDYIAFDTIVAQHGFGGVAQPSGGYWVHPVSGVYLLTYEHSWDDFAVGGTIQLELDDVAIPEGVIASGSTGQVGRGTIAYVAEAGQVGRIKITHTGASAQTCTATMHVAITDPTAVASYRLIGENVVSLGTQSAPDASGLTGYPTGWVDGEAHWIWHTTLSANSRPDGEEAWLQGLYDSSDGVLVDIEYAADNYCEVFLNGSLLGAHGSTETNVGWTTRATASATLTSGRNQFTVYAVNGASAGGANPAGFILSVRDATTGVVLFRTTDLRGWYGATAEPAGWPTP